MAIELPDLGLVFWPVGCGDSSTIVVSDKVVVQVDLRHLECANDEDDPHCPVIDELEELLPKRDDKPYLAVFVLTHPDEDHCKGFADLLDRVTIGELWFTPRVFREFNKDLCDDAKAFKTEALRRVKQTIQSEGKAESGDRVRIVGYDDLLQEDDYKGFPMDRLTIPGNEITELDGGDYSDSFRAFIHAPFKDDSFDDRNNASLGMQVTLKDGDGEFTALLLGDLAYPTLSRILDRSEIADLTWNVLLAPHHCSKSVMYWQDKEEEQATLKRDLLNRLENAVASPGYVVSSSEPVPARNESGDNPPHAKAKARYEEIVPDEFLCTQERPNEASPEPIVFELDKGAVSLRPTKGSSEAGSRSVDLRAAVAGARGAGEPPRQQVGFGQK